MLEFFKSTRFKVMVCVLAAVLAGTVFAEISADGVSPVTNVASVVFKPLRKVADTVSDKIVKFGGSFVSSSVYAEQVSELNEKLVKKNEELVDYERTKQKLKSYEEFLDIKEQNPDFEFCPATVVSRDSSDVYNSMVIDKGSVNGVKVNSPVIYGSFVVGLVKEVYATTSVVDTVLDPSLNISVYEIKTRENGYSSTTSMLSFEGKCKMSGLDRTTAVSTGGIVCTSGLGGLFPRDLIIGTVKEVSNEENDVSAYAVIEPGVDISVVADVFVITAFSGQNG